MKRTITLLAAAALMLASAVPAVAFENEFHGSYQLNFINGNFNGSQATLDPGDGFFHPEGKDASADSASFFEQRVRLQYIGKASADLKLVTKFEMDYSYWGNNSYGVARNGGGAIGSDGINFETKHLYLDVNIPATPVNVKIGMQSLADVFEGMILDTDAAGIMASGVFGPVTGVAGFFRFNDDGEVKGKSTFDLYALAGVFGFGDMGSVTAAFYNVQDDRAADKLTLNILGAHGTFNAGPASVHGCLVYEMGSVGDDLDISAFAVNAGAKVKAGPGSARAEVIYASGDDDADDDNINDFQTINGEYWFGSNELVILGRDKYSMTTDNAIVYDVNNLGMGVLLLSTGYDLPINEKFSCSANLGYAQVAKGADDRDGKDLGMEINASVDYVVMEGLTATLRAGYVALGSFFDGVALNGDDPDNPYDVKMILSYGF